MKTAERLHVELPDDDYHRRLISCQVACPVHTDARGYVRAIAAGEDDQAYLIARGPNPLASICGRVCGAPCEAACRRGKVPRVDDDGRFVANDRPIAIRALKRFVCDQAGPEVQRTEEVLARVRNYVPPVVANADELAALLRASVDGALPAGDGQRIAIIGSGPAGLAAAHDLALMGFRPVIFEMERVAAGMLALGVPAYRLPRDLIAREIDVIRALGVEIRVGVTVGQGVSLAELRRDYAAVIIAVGAKASRALGLPGERGPRVYGGVDLLRAVALGESLDVGREIVVIGGGNVAYDVARSVLRQIAYDTARTAARLPQTGRVWLAALETLEEMPADTLEILEGDEEGITRLNGWGPVEIARDAAGAVCGVIFRQCERVYDKNRKFAPIFNDTVRRTVPCDTVLLAVGQSTNLDFLSEGGQDIELMRPGWPKVDPQTLATTAPGVFVAGDLAHGTRLLIDAVASGKLAARNVYRHLTGRTIAFEALTAHLTLDRYQREPGYESIRRVPLPVAEPHERVRSAEVVVELGYDVAAARREASRCLDCGVTPVFDGQRCVLCGGCVDVCPTQCLKLVRLSDLAPSDSLDAAIRAALSEQPLESRVVQGRDDTVWVSQAGDTSGRDPRGLPVCSTHPTDLLEGNSAILKDEDRCIRCALCAERCPTAAITMERVTCTTLWRTV